MDFLALCVQNTSNWYFVHRVLEGSSLYSHALILHDDLFMFRLETLFYFCLITSLCLL